MADRRAFYEEVGRRIRDARLARKPKLTRQGLAELVSLTRTSITNVEKGRQNFLLHTLAESGGTSGRTVQTLTGIWSRTGTAFGRCLEESASL